MIDPRALRTYLVVCRERSITGAARRLNISQPAVSVTINQLEEALGTTLFERNRAGIILTPTGIALRRRAEMMEGLLRDAEEEVKLAEQGVEGPLRIGGTPGALVTLLPLIVSTLRDRDIHFAMHIVEKSDAELSELLQKGELDLAVGTTQMENPPRDIIENTIIRDPFSLIVGRKNDHLPSQIKMADTKFMRWVLPDSSGAFRRQINALFVAANAIIPNEVIRCDSLIATKSVVRESDYVTILPHGVAAAELSTGDLRSIKIIDLNFTRNIGIRHVDDNLLRDIVRKIIKDLVDMAIKLPHIADSS